MSFRRLEEFEKQRAAERAARAAERDEAEARRALKRAVKDVLPADLKKPRRLKGRPPVGGLSRRDIRALRARASEFLSGPGGLEAFAKEAQHTALVILLIDGVLGTEPWRVAAQMHGGMISANARLRYLENAARLLEDLQRSLGGGGTPLLEGVIEDAEVVEK